MGFNLGNFLRGIRDDINPFDGGKSHGNPQGRPRPASTARPQQRPQNRGGLSVQPVQQAQLAPPPPKALYEQALNAPKPLAVQPVQTPKLTIAAPQPQKPLSVGVAKPQNLQIGNTVIAPSQTQRTQTANRTKFLEQQQNPSLLDQALKTPVGGALKTASYVPGSFKDALQTVGTGIVKSGIDTAKLPYEATRLLAAEATQNDEAITNATKALHEKALGSWIAPLAQTAVLGGSTLAANELMNNTNTDEQTKQNQLQYVNEALAPIGFNLGDTQKQTNLKGASLIAQDIAVPVLSKGGNAALKSVTTGGKEAIAKGVTTKLATGQLKPVSQSLAETKGAITNTGVQLAKVTTSLVDKTKLAMPKPLNEAGGIQLPFTQPKVNQVTAPGYTKTSGKRDSVLKKLNEIGAVGKDVRPKLNRFQHKANKYLTENPEKALKDYNDRILKNFDTSKPNIVSPDDAKHIIPGFKPERSVDYHEPGKAWVKDNVAKKLLADETTKNQPVLFTGGGTGAGKTTALRKVLDSSGKKLDEYAAVFDGNMANISSAEKKIQQVLDTGRDVKIAYVYRHPVRSFSHGVIPRTKTEGRVINIDTHTKTHMDSLEVVQKLHEKFKDNPKVDIQVIDNSRGYGKSANVPVYFLKDKGYNKDVLKGELHGKLKEAKQAGQISQKEYETIRGSSVGSTIDGKFEPKLKGQVQQKNRLGLKKLNEGGYAKIPKTSQLPKVALKQETAPQVGKTDTKRVLAEGFMDIDTRDPIAVRGVFDKAGYVDRGGYKVHPDVDPRWVDDLSPETRQLMADEGITYIDPSPDQDVFAMAVQKNLGDNKVKGISVNSKKDAGLFTNKDSIVVHEIGHHKWNQLSPAEKAEWGNRPAQSEYGKRIEAGHQHSGAMKGEEEFAEQFAAQQTGRYGGGGAPTKNKLGLKKLNESGFAKIPGKKSKKEAPIVGPSLSRSKKSSLEPIIPRDAVKTPEQGIQDAIKTAEGKPPKEAKAKLLDSANNSEVIPKDIVEAIDPTRSIKTNTESWNNAGKILYENGDDGALKYFHENHSAESTAVGWRLFNKRLSNNDKPGAQELLADMTARSIENGQATQAWAMIKRLDPTYIVAKLDREVTRFSNKTSNTLKKRIDWDADKQARIMQYSKWLGDDGLITKLTKMDDNAAISKATGITDKGTLKGLARTTDPERVKMYLTNNLNKEINSIIPSTAGDKAISYWKSGLLSAPVTHVRNIVGNTMNAAANVIETPIAGAFDATVGRVLTPTKRTISANPVTGMGRGLKKGGRDFADAIETGITADDVSKYNYKTVNWNLNNPAEKYVFKPFSDAIFRTLGAEDKIFKSPGVLTSLYNQADAAAISAGKRGDAKWMADWIENSPPIVKETAKKEGGAWVFQKDTVVSTGMKGLRNSIKRSHPGYEKIVEAIQPFVNVPAAIGSELMTYTPAGLLRVANKSRKAIDKNIDLTARDLYRRQAMKDLSKTSVGVGILTAGFAMGLSGDASGNMPPKNSREYDQWVLENRQPNSIKVGGKWFNINSVGPQLTLFNAAAQTGAQMRRDKNKGKNSSPIDNAIAFGGNVGTNFLNSSSLTGATDATNALKDPARYGTNYVARQGTSFIPNFAKRAGSGFDPYQHDPQNFKEAVQAQIPGARNKLAAKTDVTGAKVPNNQHGPLAAKALFDPFNVSKSKSSALANSLADEINTDAKNKLAKDEAKKQIDGGKTTSKKPSNSGDGKVVEASNGKVVAKIDGEYKTFNNKQEAKNAVDKKNFEKSNKSYQVIGETVYTKNSQGKVSETPKSVYDYKVGSETLTMQKNSGDVAGWLDTADKQMKNIEQRLKDKNIDPLDAISLKNDAAALQKNINKYAGYGGFTKPKKGKVAKGGKGKSSGGLDYTKMLSVKSGFGSSTALRNIVTKSRIKKGKK